MKFNDEVTYQVTMGYVRKMFSTGLISRDEYRQIDTMLRDKYKPILGTLFVDLPSEQR
ncbi:MAG: hypothetical protein MJ171_08370 [Clostridia bacterium]|nr:hypothetical protein [Clostridia bacterium]